MAFKKAQGQEAEGMLELLKQLFGQQKYRVPGKDL